MNIVNNALAILVLCAIAAVGINLAIFISSNIVHDQHVSRYDCGMAEWHPDVPRQVRENCRKHRIN